MPGYSLLASLGHTTPWTGLAQDLHVLSGHPTRPLLGCPSALPSGARFPLSPADRTRQRGGWEGPAIVLPLPLISVFKQNAEGVRAPQWVWRPKEDRDPDPERGRRGRSLLPPGCPERNSSQASLSYLLGGSGPWTLVLGQVIPSFVLLTKKHMWSSQMTQSLCRGG